MVEQKITKESIKEELVEFEIKRLEILQQTLKTVKKI